MNAGDIIELIFRIIAAIVAAAALVCLVYYSTEYFVIQMRVRMGKKMKKKRDL